MDSNEKIENNININDDEISFKEIIQNLKIWINYLKSRLNIILLFSLLGGLIGLCISVFEKPSYVATISFAMDDDKSSNNGGLGGALGIASSIGIDLTNSGGGAFAASNLSELMKSRYIVEKVLLRSIENNISKTSLADYYIEKNNLKKNYEHLKVQLPPNNIRSGFNKLQDSILFQIYKKIISDDILTIQQKDKKVSILSIIVKSNDEIFSKRFCELLVEETTNFYTETKSKKAKRNVEILEKQADSIRRQLDFSISGVALENDMVYNLNPAFNRKGINSKQKQIEVQANSALLTNILVQLELAQINLRKETPLIQLIDTPKFPLERDNIGKKMSFIIWALIFGFGSIIILIFKRIFQILNQ
jgi:uncharacterized protein involved in exopolysaccharide biosynthesis